MDDTPSGRRSAAEPSRTLLAPRGALVLAAWFGLAAGYLDLGGVILKLDRRGDFVSDRVPGRSRRRVAIESGAAALGCRTAAVRVSGDGARILGSVAARFTESAFEPTSVPGPAVESSHFRQADRT